MASLLPVMESFGTLRVYVLSQIPKLAETIKMFALPGVEIRNVDLPDVFDRKLMLNEDQIEYIKEAEIAVCDATLLTNNHQNMPNLKWAHCTWAGVDGIIAAIPEAPKFVLTKHGGKAFSTFMAEYVVCHILNWERDMKGLWKSQDCKTWARPDRFFTCRTLDEISVGILGVGNMGTGIARFLQSRGTTVTGLARNHRLSLENDSPYSSITSDLLQFLPNCDYLVNTLPSTPETHGLLNDTVLQHCSKKPVFINVGRGSVIAENDLVLALQKDWISGAVLDVFENEPLPASSLLWDMPQVTITPHVAAVSKASHIAEEFCANFKRFINGEDLLCVVSWSAGY